MLKKTTVEDLKDFRLGHAQDFTKGTGCTVFVAPEGACCGASITGGAPATRETDLLRPENMIQKVHAVVLSGGSAFGLEASCGVMEALSERTIGFEIAGNRVPIVTGACLFDLTVGEFAYPDKNMGRTAVENAFSQTDFIEGNVGAGTGASVGKLRGPEHAMKSGFGFHILKHEGLVVGAFVAVNAVGNIVESETEWLAGCRDENAIVDGIAAYEQSTTQSSGQSMPTNTTIGVILTNAILDKAQATKISQSVNDAYARAIIPVHTSSDGDAIFTFASGKIAASPDLVAIIGTQAMEQAIKNAVMSARSEYGLPSASEFNGMKKR